MTEKNEDNSGLGIEFKDEALSAADIETKIETALTNDRHHEINNTVNAIPKFVNQASADHLSSTAVGHHLQAARRALAQAETAPNLANSPALSVPILGKLWGRIREQMHELVLFYVNRSGATTSRVDAQLIEAVTALTALVEAQQAELEALKDKHKKIDNNPEGPA